MQRREQMDFHKWNLVDRWLWLSREEVNVLVEAKVTQASCLNKYGTRGKFGSRGKSGHFLSFIIY